MESDLTVAQVNDLTKRTHDFLNLVHENYLHLHHTNFKLNLCAALIVRIVGSAVKKEEQNKWLEAIFESIRLNLECNFIPLEEKQTE